MLDSLDHDELPPDSDCDDTSLSCDGNGANKRTSYKSRVNFSKLTEREKITRLKNMAKKIKKLK